MAAGRQAVACLAVVRTGGLLIVFPFSTLAFHPPLSLTPFLSALATLWARIFFEEPMPFQFLGANNVIRVLEYLEGDETASRAFVGVYFDVLERLPPSGMYQC